MKKVLVVDDSKTVRLYHKEILKQSGFDTHEAENGMEALEKSLVDSYELFLVDVNMPVMDGYSFVQELRKNETYRFSPVIMISTEAEYIDRKKAYENGANLYFVKPVKPDTLIGCAEILTYGE